MAESRVRWNEIRRIGADGVEDNEERFALGRYFDAGCLATDVVGSFGYITGSLLGVIQTATANPLDPTKMPAVGMLVEKYSPVTGLVQIRGVVSPPLFVFVPNALYYISLTGLPTLTPPAFPALKQIVGIGMESGKLLLESNFSLFDHSSSATDSKTRVALVGTSNSVNRTFTTPDKFIHIPNGETIRLFHNGRRLTSAPSADPTLGDYVVSESGGIGTGFDTVTLLTFAPTATSVLQGDYTVA